MIFSSEIEDIRYYKTLIYKTRTIIQYIVVIHMIRVDFLSC